MPSPAAPSSQPPIPLVPIAAGNNNHAVPNSNTASGSAPPLATPSASSSSSPPLTNSTTSAGARTRWSKAWSFCNAVVTFFVAIATLVLAFVLFKPQALSIKLAAWTSQKDYLEYCQNHVNQPGGESDQNCENALRRVLPPPPVSRLFKRLNVTKLDLDRGPELGKFRWRHWRREPASLDGYSTMLDSDISGVGLPPLLIVELIFWLIILFVTWRVLSNACRNSSRGTQVNTPVGVDQKTKAEKFVQVVSGPYEAWVPDFVARSFPTSIHNIRTTRKTPLPWQPSKVEIDDTPPESTLRRRRKGTYVSTPSINEDSIEVPDDEDQNISCDESDSELWIPVDRPQDSWYNDRHFEKPMPTMADLIDTYASIIEVSLNQTFTFYIDKANSSSCESRVEGSEHLMTAPAYTLPMSDESRNTRAKLAVSPLVTSIRRNIMNHSGVVCVSPDLRSSWQLTLTKSDNFNAIELTSSIVKGYEGSFSFNSVVIEKVTPQMPPSSLILPFSSVTFAVHEDQHLVSIFVDTAKEYEPAWTLLIRELETLFVKGPEETLRLFRYPKGELDGSKETVPLDIWIYNDEKATAMRPWVEPKEPQQSSEIEDTFALESNGPRSSPGEDSKSIQIESEREITIPMEERKGNLKQIKKVLSPLALPSPALSPLSETDNKAFQKLYKRRPFTTEDDKKSPKEGQRTKTYPPVSMNSPLASDESLVPSPPSSRLLQRTHGEVKETKLQTVGRRNSDEVHSRSSFETQQDDVPAADDIKGRTKSSRLKTLRTRLRFPLFGAKPLDKVDLALAYSRRRGRRNGISISGISL